MTICRACLAQANRVRTGSPAHNTNIKRSERPGPVKQIAGFDVHLSCANQVEYLASKASDMLVSPEGVLTWASNGRVLHDDAVAIVVAFGFATGVNAVACDTAQMAQARVFVNAYLGAQSATPSAEEAYELRAAFGPGQTVVDVISGRKTRT